MQWIWLGMGIVLGCASCCWSAEPSSVYAGQEQREIKALSAEEIQGYLSGSGMGLAKAAELNHYPGPRHVLDLAEPLQLSEDQRQKTQSIFEAMRTEAVHLGTQLIARERQLDTLFAAGTIAEAQVDQLVADIATIHGQLRAVHLRAHLAQRTLLTPEQLHRYDMLRGYNASRHDHSAPPHRSH
ncbi:MAG TPA: Spy/CpxP family protein refolding chaperone [Candidatus Tectomicrobia bacterium]